MIKALNKRITALENENKRLKELLKINQISYEEPSLKSKLSKDEKIDIYMDYFKGRTDVFVEKYISKGKKGYNKCCDNKYGPKCDVFNTHCQNCPYFKPTKLTRESYIEHFSSNQKKNKAYGIYPIVDLDKCYFLAIDFDGEGFKEASLAYKHAAASLEIDALIELSQSGEGAHVWIFFETLIKCKDARKLGDYLLTLAINENPNISFKSYDRFFPNQDMIPKDKYGNLIALPLDGEAVSKHKTSVFVDDDFNIINDQISYLKGIKKINTSTLSYLLLKINNEKVDLEVTPRVMKKLNLKITDFAFNLPLKLSNEIYISKKDLSAKGLNFIKRLSSLHNPEFYEKQAKRLSTYNINRIIELYQENEETIAIPRGCLDDLKQCLKVVGIKPLIEDLRITKKEINVSFNGSLKPNQLIAVKSLLNYQNGLLVAPTGSGKTVMALNLITELKKPTVILVENITLLKQWVDRIKSFLTIKDENGKVINPGVYYSQKKKLTGILDVISLKSLENLDVFNNYEVVIGDEIHHIASKDYEKIIRKFNSSYTYGLTATPKRSDRLEKIIFKIIGPIRYEMKNNINEDFNKVLKVILTKYKPKENMELMNYSDIEKDLAMNLERNLIICEAVKKEYQNKKNIIILTKKIEHIGILKDLLINDCPNIYDISGQSKAKEKKAFLESIKELDEQYIIISTGKYLGEGFDLASLNTLFVAMPFKWEGTLQQYTGRLERNYNGKDEIKVYDFVDIKVRAFQNMFKVRLREYSRQNYKAIDALEDKNIIYTEANYLSKLLNDLDYAKEVILFINSYKEEKLEGFFNYDYEMIIVSDLNIRIPENVKYVKRHSLIDAIVIDRKIIYYGTINPFYYNKQDETILRIEDEEYAKELIKG